MFASFDRCQILWLAYKLEIPIPKCSILKEGEELINQDCLGN